MSETQMPYYFLASMNIEKEYEALFHQVYNEEHVPNLLAVPGVLDVVRLRPVPFRIVIAGGIREVAVPSDERAFTAMYTIADPSVLTSPEFGAAVEEGRWPREVRPHTIDRKHVLLQPFDGR